jgi:hypothetical protein
MSALGTVSRRFESKVTITVGFSHLGGDLSRLSVISKTSKA